MRVVSFLLEREPALLVWHLFWLIFVDSLRVFSDFLDSHLSKCEIPSRVEFPCRSRWGLCVLDSLHTFFSNSYVMFASTGYHPLLYFIPVLEHISEISKGKNKFSLPVFPGMQCCFSVSWIRYLLLSFKSPLFSYWMNNRPMGRHIAIYIRNSLFWGWSFE